MKWNKFFIYIIVLLMVSAGFVVYIIYGFGNPNAKPAIPTPITTFEECEKAGYPVYFPRPRLCVVDGKTFVETLR